MAQFVVSIPTLNSEETIGIAIDSVLAQSLADFEFNIVDSDSTDGTRDIARSKGVEVKTCAGKLLQARYEGFVDSECSYVIYMDSDQVLEKTALERLKELIDESSSDMVILEERSYRRDNWIQKMYDLDRRLVQERMDLYVAPETGVMLPRVFEKGLLEKAFESINRELFKEVVAHDHAIIWYECHKLSDNFAFLRNAIFHQELDSLRATVSHFARYGQNARRFESLESYNDLIDSKMSGRYKAFLKDLSWRRLLTAPLLFSKAVGYYYGYYFK